MRFRMRFRCLFSCSLRNFERSAPEIWKAVLYFEGLCSLRCNLCWILGCQIFCWIINTCFWWLWSCLPTLLFWSIWFRGRNRSKLQTPIKQYINDYNFQISVKHCIIYVSRPPEIWRTLQIITCGNLRHWDCCLVRGELLVEDKVLNFFRSTIDWTLGRWTQYLLSQMMLQYELKFHGRDIFWSLAFCKAFSALSEHSAKCLSTTLC